MTVYKPRSAWTSASRGGAQLTGTKLLGIAWHWPGTSQDIIGFETEAQVANRLRGYRNFHVNTRGWSDIGYNFAIDQVGRVWDLRGLGRVGAHAASASNPDANHEWMGVLLILGDRERPSTAMIRACQDFTHDVFLPRWPGRTRDTGHGRAPGVPGAQTSCPGPFVAELIVDDVLTRSPQAPPPQEDDMTPEQADMLEDLHVALVNSNRAQVQHPHNDGKSSVRYAVQEIWRLVRRNPRRVWSERLRWYGDWEGLGVNLAKWPDGYTAQANVNHTHRLVRIIRAEGRAFYDEVLTRLEEMRTGGQLSDEQADQLAQRFAGRVRDELTKIEVTVGIEDDEPGTDA